MQISQQSIDEVNSRADIVDVISKHIKVKKAGQNYFACCPFHNEKSASFSISPSKQIFHCFGCGESGNSITFIMKYLGLDFVSAVKSLAYQYGVYLPEEVETNSQTKEIRQQLKQHKLDIFAVIKQATLYYKQQLVSSSYANHYLTHRGLTKTTIDKFDLGFAPSNFQNLAKIFPDYKNNKLLIESGLAIENEADKRYDRFRDRIMYPIKNFKGEIIGFGGRIIAKGEPKYLNSPETELFNKSKELYGLYEAAKSIRELNQVIVVEGYMDVLALYQYGVTNVVATMGTAATEDHIKQLFRLCDNICYCFDGDNAGKKAAWRALERSVSLVTDTKSVNFLFLPADHDPDSFIRQFGTEHFLQKVKNGVIGLINFILNHLINEVQISTDEGKARLISLAKPFLERINAIALQVIFKKQLAELVNLDPSTLESILNNRTRYAFYNRKFNNISKSYASNLTKSPLDVKLFEHILLALFNNPRLAREFPTPTVTTLQALDARVSELFALIDFFELSYDDFNDINIQELVKHNFFSEINILPIYNKVKLERINYTSIFSIDPNDYREMLRKLVSPQSRKRPPKLD